MSLGRWPRVLAGTASTLARISWYSCRPATCFWGTTRTPTPTTSATRTCPPQRQQQGVRSPRTRTPVSSQVAPSGSTRRVCSSRPTPCSPRTSASLACRATSSRGTCLTRQACKMPLQRVRASLRSDSCRRVLTLTSRHVFPTLQRPPMRWRQASRSTSGATRKPTSCTTSSSTPQVMST